MSSSRLFVIGMDGMNYPLLQRFMAEGVLPTFSSLLRRGSLNRLLPTIPAWTPTNWASSVTGAPSGTTRLGGWVLRSKSDSWDQPYTMSWDHQILGGAETLWEVMDRAGMKVLITHFPSASWGAPLEHGYVVAPGVHDAPFSYANGMSYFLVDRSDVRESIDVSGDEMATRSTEVEEIGAPPGSSVLGLKPALGDGWRHVAADDLGCQLPMVSSDAQETDYLYLLVKRAEDGFKDIRICTERDGETASVDVPQEGWSPFVACRLFSHARRAATRFCVVESNAGEGTLHLVRTVLFGTEGFCQPLELSEEILNECGPFYDRASVSPVASKRHFDIWLSELRYMGEWQVKVARHIQKTRGWDAHFSHWHPFDWINHATGNGLDPNGPRYQPEKAPWLLDCQRQTYILADDILRQFLELEREGDTVCVMSDHGITPTHRTASIPDRLIERGLMYVDDEGGIDRARSVAYVIPARGCEVYVNLKGREPGGIVLAEDYEAVQEQIIDALLDWRDPITDKRPIALALKLQDAQIIGFWGDACGDVVFVTNRGYGWGKAYSLEGATGQGSIGPSGQAIHGSQIPTSETPILSNLACFVLSGPGIKLGYERDAMRWGFMRMIDLAPTFAKQLGLPAPNHSAGAVLADLFE